MLGGNAWLKVLAICGGIFSIVCAAMNFDWFMNNSRAWIFVKLFGREGARVFYVLLGLFLIVATFFF